MQVRGDILKAVRYSLIVFGIVVNSYGINAQTAHVLKSAGKIAVIDIGGNANVRIGDEFRIYRSYAGHLVEIARARATHVTRKLARVKIVELSSDHQFEKNDQAVLIPTRFISKRPDFPIYLGPSVSLFIPMHGMDEDLDAGIGYGGVLGFKFRREYDLSVRFLYTAQTEKWTFWNLQMLGRRYYERYLLIDFGYGVAYPKMNNAVGSGEIRLGFIGGLGVTLPLNSKTIFEFGAIYHYYPHFGKNPGRFATLQARLLM